MTQQTPPVAQVIGEHRTSVGTELREVFSRALSRCPGGGQLVVTKDGETIVDLAGGTVAEQTPVQVFSVSKVVVALAAAHAHAAGVLDLDAPLATYWPAFDRPATSRITARMVLDHSSGINGVDRPLSTDELLAGALEEEVARQEPRWEPGAAHGYHTFTFGALMAGAFRRATGTTVQAYAADHIVRPAGADFWFGAPDELLGDVATLSFDSPVLTEGLADGTSRGEIAPDGAMIPILTDSPGFFSDPRVIQADWPALSGVSTARSMARILNAALGEGGGAPLLARVDLEAMIAERRSGMDRKLGHVTRVGSGVELPHGWLPLLGRRSFGHQGAGGGVVAADPDSRLVLAYTHTHTASSVGVSDAALTLLGATRHLLQED